jgi:hypothetical protein
MFSSFISGFICCGIVSVVAALYYCTDKPTNESPPIIDKDELAQTILRNLAAVQMLQFHLNVPSLDYRLAKDMLALQEKHHMVLIAVPVEEVEDAMDEQMQEQAWERLKVALNVGELTEWPDETNEDYVN